MFLSSGRGFLAKARPTILFECGPSGPKAFGCTPGALYRLLSEELDYDVFFLRDWLAGGSPVSQENFNSALVYPFKAFNWIAQPKTTA